MRAHHFVGVAILILTIAVTGMRSSLVEAQQDPLVLRIATLAPRGSGIVEMFQQWDQELRRQTNDRVGIRVYAGGVAGDEDAVVRKMQRGELDGAALTTTGLGAISRPVLVLTAPGLVTSYEQLDRVRTQMAPEFNQMFTDAGYTLLTWGDVGRVRLFSRQRIERPVDLRRMRPWVWRDNPIMAEFYRATGATGVPLGLPEVYAGLQTGSIDTVLASALSVVALQWFTRVSFVSEQANGIIVGALVIKSDKMQALPEASRRYLIEQASQINTSQAIRSDARRLDDRAYGALSSRGVTAVDMSAHQSEWEQVFTRTREQLVGRLYSRELLERVARTAGN